jgi:hypothetical protein
MSVRRRVVAMADSLIGVPDTGTDLIAAGAKLGEDAAG